MTNLDTHANNFERGCKDVFAVKAADVGEMQYIRVRKDASGLGEEWHLQWAKVNARTSGAQSVHNAKRALERQQAVMRR